MGWVVVLFTINNLLLSLQENGKHHDNSSLSTYGSVFNSVLKAELGINPKKNEMMFPLFNEQVKNKKKIAARQDGNGQRAHQADILYAEVRALSQFDPTKNN